MERLETQMREMSILMAQSEAKKTEVESELKEAIDKIWVLRDIIRDLESQIEIHSKAELDLKNVATQLQNKIKEQVKYNEELICELDGFRTGDNKNIGNLSQQILQLEDEVSRLRISAELAGPDGITKQVKTQVSLMFIGFVVLFTFFVFIFVHILPSLIIDGTKQYCFDVLPPNISLFIKKFKII